MAVPEPPAASVSLFIKGDGHLHPTDSWAILQIERGHLYRYLYTDRDIYTDTDLNLLYKLKYRCCVLRDDQKP